MKDGDKLLALLRHKEKVAKYLETLLTTRPLTVVRPKNIQN